MTDSNSVDDVISQLGIGKFHFILLIIMGFIHSCDAMEMIILGFLGPFLTCYWRITSYESTFLISAAIIGNMVGAISMGKFSDKYGRKKTLVTSNAGLIYFGILSLSSPTILWLLITRFLIGFCIGGNSSAQYALMSELTPIKYRGTIMIFFQLFWAIGSYLITVSSFLIFPLFGWRLVLGFAVIPVLGVLLALSWVPESPRYLLLQNRKIESLFIINRIAKMNKAEFVHDIKVISQTTSSFHDLIHPNYLSSTILICVMLFIAGLSYCSSLLLIPIITTIPHRCLQNMSTFSEFQKDSYNNTIDNSCCSEMTWPAYKNILISTTGELILLPVSIILINLVGRKKTFAIYSVIASLGLLFLNFCLNSLNLNILLFFIRGSTVSFISVSMIYATELFPTTVRSLGLGICGCCGRIGAISSTFLVNLVIVKQSFIGGTVILFTLNIFVFIISFLLPYETKDRKLFQTSDDENGLTETMCLNPSKQS